MRNDIYRLTVQQSSGMWKYLGDFDTKEQAIEAAKTWTKDYGNSSMVWYDGLGTAIFGTVAFGIYSGPHFRHYEIHLELYKDDDSQVLETGTTIM